MSGRELKPRQAAELAEEIYGVAKGDPDLVEALRQHRAFSAVTAKFLRASIGGRLVRSATSPFGMAAMGSAHGYPGDLFLLFRGTRKESTEDIITDIRIGTINSKHIGFTQTFNSMKEDIIRYVATHRVTGSIHCIGHSLGGAVATLAAEWARSRGYKSVKLYTFGQPRVGLMDFASRFTQQMEAKNIHRVFHTTDPVPMIPIYPYSHSPLPGYGHRIKSTQKIQTAKAHDISEYKISVSGQGWDQLTRAPSVYNIEDGIKDWLQTRRDENIENPGTFAWLEKALLWLVEKLAGHLQGIQLALMGVHTFIDRVAYLLAKGIELKDKASKWVTLFMEKVMRILGMATQRFVVNPTRSFFQFLLETLSNRLYEMAKKAIRGW